MSTALEDKWNRFYREAEAGNQPPTEVLSDNAYLLPNSGAALDLACGLGANAIFLAEQGLTVTALDISSIAIEKLRSHASRHAFRIEPKQAEISSTSLEPAAYDVILISRFLDRTLTDAIINALKPGGLLFYQTFTRKKISADGPSNPAYLLDTNELLNRVRVEGSLQPKSPILERKGVYLSGILFGNLYFRDRKVLPIGDIMVYYVQKGTVGSFGNIEKGDILDGVDGHDVRSLEDLYGRLDRSRKLEKITLRLKRFTDFPVEWVFEYIEQSVKVEDLRWVSQETRY